MRSTLSRWVGSSCPQRWRQLADLYPANGHHLHLIRDSQHANPLFRSPISSDAVNILDLGTGSGEWAVDVADRYPNVTVHGVDLYPPPQTWVPPNCKFEVDDLTKPWVRTLSQPISLDFRLTLTDLGFQV